MKTKTIKKVAIWGVPTLLFLVVVTAVHIWWAYHPRIDVNTEVMARIDIKQPIGRADASRISAWLYHQRGVDHVLVNPDTRIVIFTFYPIKTSGNEIVKNFKSELLCDADRYIPTPRALASSCPVAGSSFYYKVYKFIDHIL
ncbi:MAG TPA: hypothetical protein VHS53_18845 [Mucilaginibacter sp.]|jgi:hypothetical protein|nr:hypothetical protein [Mucilaginibacter sp.]